VRHLFLRRAHPPNIGEPPARGPLQCRTRPRMVDVRCAAWLRSIRPRNMLPRPVNGGRVEQRQLQPEARGRQVHRGTEHSRQILNAIPRQWPRRVLGALAILSTRKCRRAGRYRQSFQAQLLARERSIGDRANVGRCVSAALDAHPPSAPPNSSIQAQLSLSRRANDMRLLSRTFFHDFRNLFSATDRRLLASSFRGSVKTIGAALDLHNHFPGSRLG
jgi:hypothetical protein